MRENSEQNAVCAFFSQVSLEAAQQSVVLLKNDGLLPLKTGASQPFKTIAAVRKTPF
jgi:beta-glucosidase-like glycosyl hydrolase